MKANYTLNLPHYSVGPDAYDLVGDVIRPYGRKVAVIGGETALSKAKAPLLAALEKAGAEVVDLTVYGHDASSIYLRDVEKGKCAVAISDEEKYVLEQASI